MVESIHVDQLREHGGLTGTRSAALLESALARPPNVRLHVLESDLAGLAAAYGYALARKHPFADGNKRTAFMAVYVFLAINGSNLVVAESDVVIVMLGVADGSIAEAEFAAWIRAAITKDHA